MPLIWVSMVPDGWHLQLSSGIWAHSASPLGLGAGCPRPHSAVRAACQPILWSQTYYVPYTAGDSEEIPVDPLGARLVRSEVKEEAPSSLLPLGEWSGDSKDSTGSFLNSALHPSYP